MPTAVVPAWRADRLLLLLVPALLVLSEGRNPCKAPHCLPLRQPTAPCEGADCVTAASRSHHHHAANPHAWPSHHQDHVGAYPEGSAAHVRESAGGSPSTAGDLFVEPCKGIECLLRWRESRARTSRRNGAGRAGSDQQRRAEGQHPGGVGGSGGGGSGGGGSRPAGTPRFLPPPHAELVSASSADFGPAGSPGVTLTCDVRPGENEVASEDALVLHLRLVHGQEHLLALVQSQAEATARITRELNEQQMRLLQQQQQVLDSQRHLADQLRTLEELVRQESDLRNLHRHDVKRWEDEAMEPPLLPGGQTPHRHLPAVHMVPEGGAGILRIPAPSPSLPGLRAVGRGHAEEEEEEEEAADVEERVAGAAAAAGAAAGGRRPSQCPECAPGDFCDFQRMPPECRGCSLCQPGFSELQTCRRGADRICQDKDECTENPTFCAGKCLNTPGGYRCVGVIVSDDDDESSLCANGYYLGYETGECQACSGCPDGLLLSACSADADTSCLPGPGKLAAAWLGTVDLPRAGDGAANLSSLLSGGEGAALRVVAARGGAGAGPPLGVAQIEAAAGERAVAFRQHGLVWADLNAAVRHGCRGLLQLSLRLSGGGGGDGGDGGGDGGDRRDELAAARVEPADGDRRSRQSATLSAAAELEPGERFAVVLRSPGQPCEGSGGEFLDLVPGSLSFLWLSHDTGAVALRARASSAAARYDSSYRPSFTVSQVSDPYVITLDHECSAFAFSEAGVVKFSYRQALYSVGHGCVRDGYSLGVHVSRNGSGRSEEVTRAYFPGVTYRDTAVSAAGAVAVRAGDRLSFDVAAASPHCSARLFGDASGASGASLLWAPRSAAAALAAALDGAGVATGAVRDKALRFRTVTEAEGGRVRLETGGEGRRSGHRFRVAASGVASVALHLRLIHSCETVRLSLRGAGGEARRRTRGPVAPPPPPLLQQVGGRVTGGGAWSTISLRGSLVVHAEDALFFTLDCSRGRVNNIFHDQGSHLSIMWIAA